MIHICLNDDRELIFYAAFCLVVGNFLARFVDAMARFILSLTCKLRVGFDTWRRFPLCTSHHGSVLRFFFFLGMTRVRVKLFFYLQFIYQNIRSIYFLCRVGPDELPCYTWKMPQCFMDVHKKCSNFPSKKRNDISLIPLGVIYTGAMLCNNYHHYPKKNLF